MTPIIETRAARFAELDGLRGVAALVVAFYHGLLSYSAAWAIWTGAPDAPKSGIVWWLMRTPLYLVFSGQAAVMVFFALSGAVLALTYVETDRWRYAPYLAKRIARIWLPFLAAIVLSAAMFEIVHPIAVPTLSWWFNFTSWDHPLTTGAFLRQAFMIGPTTWLDNPMWSLIHEIRISIIFPVLLCALLRARVATLLATAILSVLVGQLSPRLQSETLQMAVNTFGYLLVFAAGAALMTNRVSLKAWMQRQSLAVIVGLWAVACSLLLFNSTADPILHRVPIGLRDLPVVAGAALATALALGGRASPLSSRAPLWLGNVSYSLYLIHVPIMLLVLHLSAGRLHMPLLFVALGLSLAVAALLQRFVERPSQRLGRRIANQLSRRPPILKALSK